MRTLIHVAFALLAISCAPHAQPSAPEPPGQSLATAVGMMCDVDRLANLVADSEPLGVGRQRSAFLASHVENPDAIEFQTLLSVKGPTDQACMLRDKAKEVGLGRCALADSLDQTGMGGISP